MAKLPLDKMAAQLEDIAKDITGEYERKKVYPWDRIADATATIAEAVGAEVPEKKYSTKKAQVADTINAIADADVSGGGGSSSGPVLEWTQLVGPEDVFTYNSSNDRYTLDVEDCFGWTGSIDMEPWAIIKMEYNGDVFCSICAPQTDNNVSKRQDIRYWSFIKPESYTRNPQIMARITFDDSWNIESAQIILSSMPSSSITSGISIYGALVTGWNE